MTWDERTRSCRTLNKAAEDQRSNFQRDRDRILYSSAFRRLSGVTQIVRAGEEEVFHDRLIHSLKVSQVGRRLAESLLLSDKTLANWLSPDVVEASCLAHDLGHPPFGHCGEKKLDELVSLRGAEASERKRLSADDGGFEGNAQSFRIVTKLSVRWRNTEERENQGLDLTRATLAAILKYPWSSGDQRAQKGKWGAYETEKALMQWCRDGWPNARRTLEAEIMDWADDITYSVHDLEDFHRCGVVPWRELFGNPFSKEENPRLKDSLIDQATLKWSKEEELPPDAPARLEKAWLAISEVLSLVPILRDEKYEGSRAQRQEIRRFASMLVNIFVKGTRVAFESGCPKLAFDEGVEEMMRILKAVTINYIISSPALQAQQKGQQRVIQEVFDAILECVLDKNTRGWLPIRLHTIIEEYDQEKASARRVSSDCICTMTEAEIISLRERLLGLDGGSVFHPVLR